MQGATYPFSAASMGPATSVKASRGFQGSPCSGDASKVVADKNLADVFSSFKTPFQQKVYLKQKHNNSVSQTTQSAQGTLTLPLK